MQVLETERLLLRPPRQEDLEGWATMMADEESSKFIGGPVARAAAWRGMATMAGSWTLKGFGMFSVIEKATGEWIGRLGPWQPEEWPGSEIGWGLVKNAWGKGFATEGAIATMDWAFDHLGWSEVIHCIDPANQGSISVAQRLGSSIKGRSKLPPPFDHVEVDVWGQTAQDWASRRKR